MGLMFWIWILTWIAGWIIIIGIHFWYKKSTRVNDLSPQGAPSENDSGR